MHSNKISRILDIYMLGIFRMLQRVAKIMIALHSKQMAIYNFDWLAIMRRNVGCSINGKN